jgi:hypothetical protein
MMGWVFKAKPWLFHDRELNQVQILYDDWWTP